MNLEDDPSIKLAKLMGHTFEIFTQSIPLLTIQIINNSSVDINNLKLDNVNYTLSALNFIDLIVEFVLGQIVINWSSDFMKIKN